MGIDMKTYGGSVRLRDGVAESEAADLAVAQLTAPGGYDDQKHYRPADVDTLSADCTLEQLFRAFRMYAIRNNDGALVSVAGYDDRWCDPEPMFAALAASLADGSWFACSVEDGSDRLFIITGCSLTTLRIPEGALDPARACDNLADKVYQDWLGASFELPFTSDDPPAVKLTALAQAFANPDQLHMATLAPVLYWADRLALVEGAKAYIEPDA